MYMIYNIKVVLQFYIYLRKKPNVLYMFNSNLFYRQIILQHMNMIVFLSYNHYPNTKVVNKKIDFVLTLWMILILNISYAYIFQQFIVNVGSNKY